MGSVFISYRRSDSLAITGRIYDHLETKFGRKSLFKDVDDIPPAVDFGDYIQDSLRLSSVALVIIGPHWLGQREDGSKRLDDPTDWVRIELETAFALQLTIIPLLVDGATMPTAADLTDSLKRLARINTLTVGHDPAFRHDIEGVFKAIESHIRIERLLAAVARWIPGLVALAIILLAIAFLISSSATFNLAARDGLGNGLALVSLALSAVAWGLSLMRLYFLRWRAHLVITFLCGVIAFLLCLIGSYVNLASAPLIVYYLPYLLAALVPLIERLKRPRTAQARTSAMSQSGAQEVKL
jgi:hypothetical protein